ncbi:hypothetical protein HOI83_04100 [Candidatus Uhrbacteria bacterium]|nr:hypothetical protein [Candidatus Uhrbacteria bacterium]
MTKRNKHWPPKKGMTIFKLFIFYFGSMGWWGITIPIFDGASDEAIAVLMICLAIYLPLLAFAWMRITSRAMSIKPPQGVEPVAEDELRKRLMKINDLDVPFTVRKDRHDGIIVTWNIVDEKWGEVLAAYSIKMVQSIRIRIDEKDHTVLAQDQSISRKKAINLLSGEASFSMSFFKGIDLLSYDRAIRGGLIFKNGKWKLGKAYSYRFSLAEMKNPLIDVIGHSGWTYKPTLSFWRWLGG